MDEIREKLIEILQQYTDMRLTLEDISESTPIVRDLGISSIRRMDIILDVEEFYNMEFDEKELGNITTFNELVQLIQKKLNI